MWESGEPRQVTWGTGTVLPESEAPLTPLVLTAGGSREPAIHPSVSGGIDVIGKAERGTVRPVAVGGQMPWGEAVSQGCERLWALTGRGREAKGRRKSRRKQQAHPSLYKQPPPTAQMQIFSFVGGGGREDSEALIRTSSGLSPEPKQQGPMGGDCMFPRMQLVTGT